MFEFFRYDAGRHSTPAAALTEIPERPRIARKSFLFWGEHCVECAAPSCYASCSLYEPRSDGRCRRFRYGIHANDGANGHAAAELVFKQWAQLGTCGNLRLESVEQIERRERWVRRLVPVVDAMGTIMWKVTGDTRFRESAQHLLERYCRALHRKAEEDERPDGFLFEVYNPGATAVRFQLRISAAAARSANGTGLIKIRPTFQTWLEASPGYSRHELEYELFRKIVEREPFDITLTPEADTEAAIVVLAADFVKYEKTASAAGTSQQQIKCIVWDLDNTAWNGILLENEDVQMRPGILEAIRDLDARGILHSVASKNSHEHAWPAIERLGFAEYLLHPQISWSPKSIGIRKIAQQLNIGLDTFAFVDDNPFELDEVRRALPQVTCIHVDELAEALKGSRFAGSTTRDARERRLLYKQAIARDEAMQDFGADYTAFLADAQIVLELSDYADESFDRVNELVQRTNQLNFSGRKYKPHEVEALLKTSSGSKYVLRCSDRYGSYGTVGFAIAGVNGETLEIQDFMLSCRVQGKFIEQAFFRHLFERHHPAVTTLWVNFKRTDKNTPAHNLLSTLGFADDPRGGMSLGLQPESLACRFIDVRCISCTRP